MLFGAIGVYAGFPLADPLVGLGITLLIGKIVWDSAKLIFTRLLDGVEPNVVDEITRAARETSNVEDVAEVRVRWLGHRLHAEINLAVNSQLTVSEAHNIAVKTEQRLLEKVKYLSSATIHVDPLDASGESYHQVETEPEHNREEHEPVHSH